MYLFFDTETTGLPKNWNAPVTDLNNWPRLIQIAWIYCDIDGNIIDEDSFIIKPENFIIPIEASRVHGIYTEKALNEGENLEKVLLKFNKMIELTNVIVAHNISFDEKIIGAEFLRKGILSKIDQKRKLCTMKSSTNYCKIPGSYGYKWPKLSELYLKLFDTKLEEAHSAAVDVHATVKCFWEMKRLNLI